MPVTKQMVDEFVEQLERMHEEIISQSGGEHGIRDKGGLAHAAFEILRAAEKFVDKPFHGAAIIYNLIATRHYFVDGNKRTSHFAARAWLLSRNYDFKVSYEDAVPFIMSIARDKPLREIEEWIKENAVKHA